MLVLGREGDAKRWRSPRRSRAGETSSRNITTVCANATVCASDSAANGVADEEEGAAAIVKKVLDKFELKALSAEEQLSQLCLVVNDVCNENAR